MIYLFVHIPARCEQTIGNSYGEIESTIQVFFYDSPLLDRKNLLFINRLLRFEARCAAFWPEPEKDLAPVVKLSQTKCLRKISVKISTSEVCMYEYIYQFLGANYFNKKNVRFRGK